MLKNQQPQQMNWLFNQEQAEAIIKIINPREFSVIEAILSEDGESTKVAETDEMVQWSDTESKMKLIMWMAKVNVNFKHEPGERYIYFRFIRLPF